jgi:hypothetical protein
MPDGGYAAGHRYLVQKAEGVTGNPIPEDEPCIVIRGQDRLALTMLDSYITYYSKYCPAPDKAVVAELWDHRRTLVEWQTEHRPKWADR